MLDGPSSFVLNGLNLFSLSFGRTWSVLTLQKHLLDPNHAPGGQDRFGLWSLRTYNTAFFVGAIPVIALAKTTN
jgi:hypothetical protein